MEQLQPGVWHWTAPHPEWKAGDDWGELVSSYAVDDGRRLLLFDPLAVPAEIEELAAGRETAIVLTCPWHARDANELAGRLGASLHVPPPEEGDAETVDGHVYSAGDELPVGVRAFPGMVDNDLVLWVESRRAIVSGDTLVDRGNGLEIPPEWMGDRSVGEVADGLRPLLELPVELMLATHGGPMGRAALVRALARET